MSARSCLHKWCGKRGHPRAEGPASRRVRLQDVNYAHVKESTASLTEGHHFSRNNVWGRGAVKHLTTGRDF